MSLTRRAMLGGIIAVSIAACRPHRPTVPSTDLANIDEALDGERALLARYAAAMGPLDEVAAEPLRRARDRHAAHLHALETVRRPPRTAARASPAPTAGVPDLAALGTVLAASAADLRAAATHERAGGVAALLASIAAEHEASALFEGRNE